MAFVMFSLPRAVGAGRKLSIQSASITSTGAVTTGLAGIDPGGALVTPQASATTLTAELAAITSISGGTVNVAVSKLTYSGPTIALDGGAQAIGVWATGH